MNEQQTDSTIADTRVLGIFAHVDAGKTTTSEGLLYCTGRIHRMGSVDDGDTQLDWMPQERERGITITAAATTCVWHDKNIHLIDTPGHIDFSAEVIRSMRVIDGAVIILCAVGGVEAQTETVWLHADRERLPRLILVNKLDRVGASHDRVMQAICQRLAPQAVSLHVPIGREEDFCGLVELLEGRALVWSEGSVDPLIESVPPSLHVQVAAARARLVEAICATDDALLAQWLGGREPPVGHLRVALRRATIAGTLVPVLLGSALRRIGLQPLLDAIAYYLPSPLDSSDRHAGTVGRPGDPVAPLHATAFKIVTDPYVGHTTWVRVYSGQGKLGDTVYNPRTGSQERVTRIYRMHANRREPMERMLPGDVVALVGTKSAITGDTLCDPHHSVAWSPLAFPEPVIMVALRPAADEDAARMHQAIASLCREDPTLASRYDTDTREETLSGMGELHLEIAVDRLRREFGLNVAADQPQVAYRETVTHTGEAEGAYIKQTGGSGHFARVYLRVEPLARGAGVLVENASPAAAGPSTSRVRRAGIPPSALRSVETGVREVLQAGILGGFPITDVRVTILGGQHHAVDSAPLDFYIAACMAVRQAARVATPALLEPIMRVDVQAPSQHLGSIAADLCRRRGHITASESLEHLCRATAEVPVAEMHDYATALRDMTHGHCAFTMEFRRYDLLPDTLRDAVVARRQAEGKVIDRGGEPG